MREETVSWCEIGNATSAMDYLQRQVEIPEMAAVSAEIVSVQ